MQIQELQREFKYNGVSLADPNPEFTLAQVRDFYSTVYPDILNAEIEGPEAKANKNVYTFRRAVGTKGGSKSPALRYLTRLRWDGTERLATWMVKLLSAADNPYIRAVSARWMIGAVARAYERSARFDTPLVLQGDASKIKAQALHALTPDSAGFAMIDAASVGGPHASPSAWIVVLTGIDKLSSREMLSLKGYISADTLADGNPPTCAFAATSTAEMFHSRRFWPVTVGEIDLEGIEHMRDQLWAEAVYRYSTGERWTLDPGMDASQADAVPLATKVSELAALIELGRMKESDAGFVKGMLERVQSHQLTPAFGPMADRIRKLHLQHCMAEECAA